MATVIDVTDLFLIRFGDGDGDSPHAREQARIRPRYVELVVRETDLDPGTAERVVAAIFDHRSTDGRACVCGCHPHFSATHDDGFDCSCTWDDERRAEERHRWTAWQDSAEAAELRAEHDREMTAISAWIASQPGVTAEQTTSAAPEQWEGTVDGHSFYFRERGGEWRIELDLEPNGTFANRLVGFDNDGTARTEPHELSSGRVVARGIDDDLGDTPVARLDFIVRAIRDHLWAEACEHQGALFYCPLCGTRM